MFFGRRITRLLLCNVQTLFRWKRRPLRLRSRGVIMKRRCLCCMELVTKSYVMCVTNSNAFEYPGHLCTDAALGYWWDLIKAYTYESEE